MPETKDDMEMFNCPLCQEKGNTSCILCKGTLKIERVTSVDDFLAKIKGLAPKDGKNNLFFRGETSCYFDDGKTPRQLKPTICRSVDEDVYNYDDNVIGQEHLMFKEIISRSPTDFKDTHTTFDKLVLMQHYYLPTRLLDITANQLVSLYFACLDCDKKKEKATHGIVYIFQVRKEKTKFFDSDTVSILSNLAKLDKNKNKNKNFIYEIKYKKKAYEKLLYEVRQEKMAFEDGIQLDDLYSILCVQPKQDNSRIKAQHGAFFLFGIHNESPHNKVPDIEDTKYIQVLKLLINKDSKKTIMDELEKLNIHEGTLFPEMDHMATYIKKKYANHVSEALKDAKEKFDETLKPRGKESSDDTDCLHIEIDKNYVEFIKCPDFVSTEMVSSRFEFPSFLNDESKQAFITMLFNSFSLSMSEKERVLEELENLSQYQVKSLVEVWYEENIKFQELGKEYSEDIGKLVYKTLQDWSQLFYEEEDFIEFYRNYINKCTISDLLSSSFYLYYYQQVIIKTSFLDTELKSLYQIIAKNTSTDDEAILLLLLQNYEKTNGVNITKMLEWFINDKVKPSSESYYKKYYDSLGIFCCFIEQYAKARDYFELIQDDSISNFLSYIEAMLLSSSDKDDPSIEPLLAKLDEKYLMCDTSKQDYGILNRFIKILILFILSKEVKTEVENLHIKVKKMLFIDLNWNMREIEAIITKYHLENQTSTEEFKYIIDKIKQGNKPNDTQAL